MNTIITSKDNELFKKIKKLKEKKYREREKMFLAEGTKFLEFGIEPAHVFVDSEKRELIKSIPYKYYDKVTFLSEPLIKDLSSQETPQGVIIVFNIIESSGKLEGKTVLVADRIQDPGNIGTIIRVADAAGTDEIIIIKGTVDIYSEKVVRATMGSIFAVKFHFMESEEAVMKLKENGYKITATTLSDRSIDYSRMEIGEKNAVIVGNEGSGVSEYMLANADEHVKIPLYGSAESLNVGVATGIILYKMRELRNK